MLCSMVLIQTNLNALDLAIAHGTPSVKFDSHQHTCKPPSQLIATRDHVTRLVNGGE
jgi:hypothetical protein